MILAGNRQHFDSRHAHERRERVPYVTLELTLSGVMLRGRPGEDLLPQRNGVIYQVPAFVLHALRGREPGEELWFVFEPREDLLDCLDWPCGPFGTPELELPRSALGRQIIEAFDEILRELAAHHRRRELRLDHAADRLLLLCGLLCDEGDRGGDERVARALDVMRQHLTDHLTVADLARAAHLSPSRFAHLFRRLTGESPMACLERMRLEEARRLLLRTELPVQQIARRVGFDDPFYFSTRFRRAAGRSPSAWRRNPSPQ